MIVADRRAYKDLVGWMKAARPSGVGRAGFTVRRFRASFLSGLALMGSLSLIDPAAFGQSGAAYSLGWGGWLAIGVFVVTIIYGYVKRKAIFELVQHLREPLVGPLEDNPNFEGAHGALAACSPAFVARFGAMWVWGPAALLVVGVLFAFSNSYFVIDALLARFDVGYGTGVLFGADLVISLLSFALAARRLSTWRLAVSVHKATTTGYPA